MPTTDDEVDGAVRTFVAQYAQHATGGNVTLEWPAMQIAMRAALEPVVTAALAAVENRAYMGALKSIAGIATAIMVLAMLVLVVGAVLWLHGKNAVATKAQQTAGHAVVAEHQAQAAQQAQAIVVRGGARDHVDVTIHQESAHVIEALPGASTPLGAAFVSGFDQRVSLHSSIPSSRGQPAMRASDPAQLPDPDPGAAAPPA